MTYVCGCGCGALLMAPGDRRDGFLLGHRATPRQRTRRRAELVASVAIPLGVTALAVVRGFPAVAVVIWTVLCAVGALEAFYPRLAWRLDLMHWVTGRDRAYDWWVRWARARGWIVMATMLLLALLV